MNETDRMMPTINSELMSDEPPDDMKGNGLPVIGKKPITQRILMKACATSMVVSAPAMSMP